MVIHRIIKIIGFMLSVLLFIALPVAKTNAFDNNRKILYDRYEEIKPRLEKTPYGIPLLIKTDFPPNKIHCDVYGVMDHPFALMRKMLLDPVNWCDILLLHTHIKSCTWGKNENHQDFLTLYFGGKAYQLPEDAYQLALEFHGTGSTEDYFDVRLSADKGPFFTRHYRVELDAVPLPSGKTFIRLSYEYDYGPALESALKIYYATLGRNKVGFTVVDRDKTGNPVYVKGNQGMIERNSVRCYFSVQSFLEAQKYPEKMRFNERIRRWYALVSQCPKQLYEFSENEYFENKVKENANQIRLQKGLPGLNDKE
jgi:hypothetical protein